MSCVPFSDTVISFFKQIRPECHCPREQGRCRQRDLPKHCRKNRNKHENVFKKLRRILNEDYIDILLGLKGDVSLIFVMDTSGSMGNEIEAAKKISKAIAAFPRKFSVNYILSPFSDPSKCCTPRGGGGAFPIMNYTG